MVVFVVVVAPVVSDVVVVVVTFGGLGKLTMSGSEVVTTVFGPAGVGIFQQE